MRSHVSPNIVRTVLRYVLGFAVIAGAATLTCGCKASGHIDFEIDVPALELAVKQPATEPES